MFYFFHSFTQLQICSSNLSHWSLQFPGIHWHNCLALSTKALKIYVMLWDENSAMLNWWIILIKEALLIAQVFTIVNFLIGKRISRTAWSHLQKLFIRKWCPRVERLKVFLILNSLFNSALVLKFIIVLILFFLDLIAMPEEQDLNGPFLN